MEARRLRQVDFDVAVRVHHCRDPFRAEQVRCVRQAAEVELLKVHGPPCSAVWGNTDGLLEVSLTQRRGPGARQSPSRDEGEGKIQDGCDNPVVTWRRIAYNRASFALLVHFSGDSC